MSKSKPLPVVDFLKIPEDGNPYLEDIDAKNADLSI